ncbi:hypothetical protein CLM65_11020 [Serratia marcescens]|uniref:Phage-related protein n=1 Tax=Serratia marcescens TaxID=615 RepID=A0A345IQF0_SERMA|nr:hypothetical protein [Serratia marcescens]AWC73626.1 hypothetical protein AM371_01125 [Serratia marcescens]AXH02072.1 phage-related protein [Serratia marcescens]AXH02746.1 phage-related protein [Serratia marcescens]EIJ6701982.1 hypothetical protein [Serratia marcescens]EIV5186790.1 hypothetical protein [Serratia marcescens]
MKERPVIFNGEMVRAILDGRKTQTRRALNWKRQPYTEMAERDDGSLWPWAEDGERGGDIWFPCPFGEVGDRLWVRETFQGPLIPEDELSEYLGANPDKFQSPAYCEYAADGGAKPEYVDSDENTRYGWRPSIHMPRWASRITLEITAVRVERLNDISDGDAIREGCSAADMKSGDCVADVFARLWASIYGVDSWNANPWVWVLEFKQVSEESQHG